MFGKHVAVSGVAILALVGAVGPASAQTMMDTLALAYSNNPTLNAARSRTRSSDEGVGIALSGYRPQISASASAAIRQTTVSPGTSFSSRPRSVSLTLVQPLFSGFQTTNSVRQSEAAVRAQRELTRNTEQDVLFDAATAFMDVIRDTALVGLRETNVKFLTEQVRAARDRFNVGEGTRTDVAQAEARQQLAVSELNSARATANASRATYRQVVGVEPKKLTGSAPLERLMPKSVQGAVEIAQAVHPAILAGVQNIDVAAFNVKVLEGELLPSLNLQGSVSRSYDSSTAGTRTDTAQVGVNLTVPIYQGGAEFARIRQAKEDLGTARIQVDVTRDQVRQAAIAAWGQLEAANASIIAAQAQVEASQLALNGVLEEQRVGQRTTLDVLNAQNELIDAKVNLVLAQRNRVVAAFSLTASIGRLDAANLRLSVVAYKPEEHYDAVRDKWFGLRTPDGR